MSGEQQECPKCRELYPKGSLQMTPDGTSACATCGMLAMQDVHRGASSGTYANGMTTIGGILSIMIVADLVLNLFGLTFKLFMILDVFGDGLGSRLVMLGLGVGLYALGAAWKKKLGVA